MSALKCENNRQGKRLKIEMIVNEDFQKRKKDLRNDLRHGADPCQPSSTGDSAIHLAVKPFSFQPTLKNYY